MTSGGHTKGPWRFVPSHVSEGDSEVRHPDGWLICCTPSDELAQLIVTAVNTYPAVAELVEALDEACDYFIPRAKMSVVKGAIQKNSEHKLLDKIEASLTRFREAQAGGGR